MIALPVRAPHTASPYETDERCGKVCWVIAAVVCRAGSFARRNLAGLVRALAREAEVTRSTWVSEAARISLRPDNAVMPQQMVWRVFWDGTSRAACFLGVD